MCYCGDNFHVHMRCIKYCYACVLPVIATNYAKLKIIKANGKQIMQNNNHNGNSDKCWVRLHT